MYRKEQSYQTTKDRDRLKKLEKMKYNYFLIDFFFCVPVNSLGHVGKLPPFYGTFTKNKDVMTSNKFLKYNHPTKPQKAYTYEWFDFNHFPWQAQT